jgi:hypothetical protein
VIADLAPEAIIRHELDSLRRVFEAFNPEKIDDWAVRGKASTFQGTTLMSSAHHFLRFSSIISKLHGVFLPSSMPLVRNQVPYQPQTNPHEPTAFSPPSQIFFAYFRPSLDQVRILLMTWPLRMQAKANVTKRRWMKL